MKICYTLDDVVFACQTVECLEKSVKEFLHSKGLEFNVVRDGASVIIDYPDDDDIDANEDEQIVLSFCRDHRFGKAKKVVRELLQKRPWSSEGYRLLAQIEMENGETDSALEHARDAVRLNPGNLYALTLLANLLSRDKGLLDEGLVFTRRAYELYPDSPLAVNNYAGNLMHRKDASKDELESLFKRAIELDSTYMNPYYGLSQVYLEKGESKLLFEIALEGLRKGIDRPENSKPIREFLSEILVGAAHEQAKIEDTGLLEKIRCETEKVCGVKVKIVEDMDLSVPARMELAEKYHREEHRLLFNPSKVKSSKIYCLVHELEKCIMRAEANGTGRGASFAVGHEGRQAFFDRTRYLMTDKFRSRVPDGQISEMLSMLLDGIGGQMMNCPLDIFVSKRLFEKYPSLRAAQVAATVDMMYASVQSVKVGVQAGFPKNVVHLNRTLSVVAFLSNRRLFGLDFVPMLEATDEEIETASNLLKFCMGKMARFVPGDEWDCVREFLRELHCADYFQIVDEQARQKELERQKKSSDAFRENFAKCENPNVNMAVTMHMVEAIKRLEAMALDDVRRIAAEIAMIGTGGISPDRKSGYIVRSLGGEEMSGCRILAYYYVSWKIGFPEKLGAIGLPFENEYVQAKGLAESGI